MKIKRILAVLMLTVMCLGMLTACGPPEDPTPDPGPDPGPGPEPVEDGWKDPYAEGLKYMIQGEPAKAYNCFKEAVGYQECPERCRAAYADACMLIGRANEGKDAFTGQDLNDYLVDRVTAGAVFLTDGTPSVFVTGVYFDPDDHAAGKTTRYAVTVEYVCPDGASCTIQCSANTKQPGYYSVFDKKEVTGSGAVQFFLEGTPAEHAGDTFAFYAALYDNGQNKTWLPCQESNPYYVGEDDNARWGTAATEAEAAHIIRLYDGRDCESPLARLLFWDPSIVCEYSGKARGISAPEIFDFIFAAEVLAEGDPNAPAAQKFYDEGDYSSDSKYYADMISKGILTENEAKEAKKEHYTQFASLEWVQYMFDRLFGKGVIDVYGWDFSDSMKTSGGYMALQPFGVEDVLVYSPTYKGFTEKNIGGEIAYTALRTEQEFGGSPRYYDCTGNTKIKKDAELTVWTAYVTRDARGVHLSPAFANFNAAFYVNASSGLRCRKGPGTGFDKRETLKDRTPIYIIEEMDGWGRVYGTLEPGWVSLEYVDTVVASYP